MLFIFLFTLVSPPVSIDLSWQSSLSSSAVGAVLEVRDAVRASNTASRAKSAAYIAADRAKKAYESCDHSSSMEKAQSALLEASNAQSHAIHSTVVEYEANLAKKRSAVSFAQDVQSWNIHRKKELLRTCVQATKSQQQACRKAADALEGIRDGLIDSSGYSFAEAEVTPWSEMKFTSAAHSRPPSTDQLNVDRQVTATTSIQQTQLGTYNADDFTGSNSSSLNERPPCTDQLNVNSQVTTTTAILQTQVGTSNADDFTRNNSGSLNDWDTRKQVFNDNDIYRLHRTTLLLNYHSLTRITSHGATMINLLLLVTIIQTMMKLKHIMSTCILLSVSVMIQPLILYQLWIL